MIKQSVARLPFSRILCRKQGMLKRQSRILCIYQRPQCIASEQAVLHVLYLYLDSGSSAYIKLLLQLSQILKQRTSISTWKHQSIPGQTPTRIPVLGSRDKGYSCLSLSFIFFFFSYNSAALLILNSRYFNNDCCANNPLCFVSICSNTDNIYSRLNGNTSLS